MTPQKPVASMETLNRQEYEQAQAWKQNNPLERQKTMTDWAQKTKEVHVVKREATEEKAKERQRKWAEEFVLPLLLSQKLFGSAGKPILSEKKG